MKWFGASWGAAVCREADRIDVPVGERCTYCVEDILAGDRGLLLSGQPLHLECYVRSVAGSVGHQRHRCSCYGGNEEDPPGVTRREAALAALRCIKEMAGW
jgi:hypothetical protein